MVGPVKPELPEALLWTWPRPQPGGDPFIPWLVATGSESERTTAINVQLDLQKSVLEAQLKAIGQIKDLISKR
jgi:hypothetical protein